MEQLNTNIQQKKPLKIGRSTLAIASFIIAFGAVLFLVTVFVSHFFMPAAYVPSGGYVGISGEGLIWLGNMFFVIGYIMSFTLLTGLAASLCLTGGIVSLSLTKKHTPTIKTKAIAFAAVAIVLGVATLAVLVFFWVYLFPGSVAA